MERDDWVSAGLYSLMAFIGLLGLALGAGEGDWLTIGLSFGLVATVFHASTYRWIID